MRKLHTGKALHMYRRLRPYLRAERRLIYLTLLVVPIISLLNLFQPYLVKVAVDQHIILKDWPGLRTIVLFYLILFVSEYALNYLQILFMQLTGQRIVSALRRDLFAKIQTLNRSYLEKTPNGVTVSRVTSDCDVISEMFSSGIVSLGWDFFRLFLIVSMMIFLDFKLTLVAFSIIPVLMICVHILRRRLNHGYEEVRKVWASLNGFVQEHLQGIRVIQLFLQEKKTAQSFLALNRQYRDTVMKTVNDDAMLYAVVEALGSIALGLMIWYGGGQWVQNQLTLGVLIAFIEYVQRFFVPIRDLSAKVAVIQSAQVSTERVFSLLEEKTENHHLGNEEFASHRLQEGIVFEGVGFAYQPDKPVLQNISFQIQAGEKIGLVGVTGSGKTTVFKLLGRHVPIQKGRILLDGRNINDFSIEAIRRSFAYVPQDVFLFSGSLFDNFRLFNPTVTRERVEAMIEKVGISAFTAHLDAGLDFLVTPNGGNLSMGQRQLVAIGRAFLFETPVLLLDEVTSYMDSLTAKLIQGAIDQLSKDGRTVIISSHRLSTLKNVDRMIILHQGLVQDIGSPQELLRRDNVLSQLSGAMAKLTA